MLTTPEKAKELGLKPICRIIGIGLSGVDPRYMGLGPVEAAPKALKMAGLTVNDMSVIELNEAFAAQALGVIRQLGWEDKMDIINPNGSGISLGHPIGCTGCRIIVTLMNELRRRGGKYGLATLCIGGGMGQATVIEML
jgi:acetyl-CoA C-acetyltransferase